MKNAYFALSCRESTANFLMLNIFKNKYFLNLLCMASFYAVERYEVKNFTLAHKERTKPHLEIKARCIYFYYKN